MPFTGCWYFDRKIVNYQGRCAVCGSWVKSNEPRSAHSHGGRSSTLTASDLPPLPPPPDAEYAP